MRQRTPMEIVVATGRDKINPARYADRASFTDKELSPIGDPPKSAPQRIKKLWAEFVNEFPWLRESDRAAIYALCVMRRVIEDNSDECDAKFFKQYFDALKAIGGTPAERTKMPKDRKDADKSDDDDGEKYVNWN